MFVSGNCTTNVTACDLNNTGFTPDIAKHKITVKYFRFYGMLARLLKWDTYFLPSITRNDSYGMSSQIMHRGPNIIIVKSF